MTIRGPEAIILEDRAEGDAPPGAASTVRLRLDEADLEGDEE